MSNSDADNSFFENRQEIENSKLKNQQDLENRENETGLQEGGEDLKQKPFLRKIRVFYQIVVSIVTRVDEKIYLKGSAALFGMMCFYLAVTTGNKHCWLFSGTFCFCITFSKPIENFFLSPDPTARQRVFNFSLVVSIVIICFKTFNLPPLKSGRQYINEYLKANTPVTVMDHWKLLEDKESNLRWFTRRANEISNQALTSTLYVNDVIHAISFGKENGSLSQRAQMLDQVMGELKKISVEGGSFKNGVLVPAEPKPKETRPLLGLSAKTRVNCTVGYPIEHGVLHRRIQDPRNPYQLFDQSAEHGKLRAGIFRGPHDLSLLKSLIPDLTVSVSQSFQVQTPLLKINSFELTLRGSCVVASPTMPPQRFYVELLITEAPFLQGLSKNTPLKSYSVSKSSEVVTNKQSDKKLFTVNTPELVTSTSVTHEKNKRLLFDGILAGPFNPRNFKADIIPRVFGNLIDNIVFDIGFLELRLPGNALTCALESRNQGVWDWVTKKKFTVKSPLEKAPNLPLYTKDHGLGPGIIDWRTINSPFHRVITPVDPADFIQEEIGLAPELEIPMSLKQKETFHRLAQVYPYLDVPYTQVYIQERELDNNRLPLFYLTGSIDNRRLLVPRLVKNVQIGDIRPIFNSTCPLGELAIDPTGNLAFTDHIYRDGTRDPYALTTREELQRLADNQGGDPVLDQGRVRMPNAPARRIGGPLAGTVPSEKQRKDNFVKFLPPDLHEVRAKNALRLLQWRTVGRINIVELSAMAVSLLLKIG